MNKVHITINIDEDCQMEWITCGIEKPYNGYWQRAESPLAKEEINQILTILEKHTPDLYIDGCSFYDDSTEEDWIE